MDLVIVAILVLAVIHVVVCLLRALLLLTIVTVIDYYPTHRLPVDHNHITGGRCHQGVEKAMHRTH